MKYEIVKEYVDKETEHKLENKRPSLYQVLMHKDDVTPIQFIKQVLESLFYLDKKVIEKIVSEARENGKAVCGIFTKEVAETKLSQVKEYARVSEHPLVCSMEVH